MPSRNPVRPNQRVQLTPLCGPKVVRILKVGFVPNVVSISTAAQLTRKPLGGNHSAPMQE
jgi:hypothetical protein